MDSLATIQPGRLEGLNVGGIHTFLGIPYAKAPVGSGSGAPSMVAGARNHQTVHLPALQPIEMTIR